MGGIGFGLRVPRQDGRCAVCGRVIRAAEGRLPTEYDRKKMVHWNDFSRPIGDTSRVAHPSCLRDLQDHPSKWPAGLHYAPIPTSDDAARQTQARKKLEAEGCDKHDAFIMDDSILRTELCAPPLIRDDTENGVKPRQWHPPASRERERVGVVPHKVKAKNRAARKAAKQARKKNR